MANTQETTSTQPAEKGLEVNLVDIFFYLLRFWYLYVICVGIVVAFALYRTAKQPYIYEASVKVFIKDASQRSMMDADVLRYMRSFRLNMDNEKMQMSSRRVLERAVKTVNANVYYQVQSGLRTLELYTAAPFSMRFLDSLEKVATYEVRFKDAGHVSIQPQGSSKAQDVPLNVPVQLGPDRFIIEPRSNFNTAWEHKTINVIRHPLVGTARYYQNAVAISQPQEKSSTLMLSLQDRTKQRALDILTAQVAAYNQEEVEMRSQISVNTANFVNERIAVLSKELGIVENEMESFLVTNRTLDFDAKMGRYNTRSVDYEVQAMEIETQLKLVSFMLSNLSSPQKQTEYMPLNIGVSDPNLDGYIAKYNQLKADRDRLVKASEGSTENPVIAEYDRGLAQIRQNAISSLNQYANVLRVRLKDAQGTQSSLLSQLPDVSNKGREKAEIDRKIAIRERLYTELLNKREEYALMQAMTQDSAYILDMNDAPAPPVSPNKTRTVLLAILIGLALPTIGLIIRLLADNKVRTRKDILDRLTIPFLGDIPKEDAPGRKQPRGAREQGSDETSESFRVLRENLRFMIGSGDTPSKKIIFTSFGESAGKSYVSYNLAKTLTFSGSTVVVVDLDLRKGTLLAEHT